jgi:hypothetical protein
MTGQRFMLRQAQHEGRRERFILSLSKDEKQKRPGVSTRPFC